MTSYSGLPRRVLFWQNALFLCVIFGGSVSAFAILMTSGIDRESDPENLRVAVSSNNAFSLELYSNEATSTEGNFMLSPASVSSVMAMLIAGADGETRDQILQTLHFSTDDEVLHDGFSQLSKMWNDAETVELNLANRLWPATNQSLLPEYLSLTENYYGAKVESVDYGKPNSATDTINNWVAEQTKDRITGLLQSGDVDSSTRMVLTNAVYFKGDWKSKFSTNRTRDAAFTTADGTALSVPMMDQTSKFAFAEMDGNKFLEMPYAGNRYSMLFVLPKTHDGLSAIESALTVEKLDGWIKKMATQNVRVKLPKFKSVVRIDLTKRLSEMGMPSVFGASANFSGMTGQRDMFVDSIIHKTFIEVNEEGAEAAGASAATVKRSAKPRQEEIATFVADKPFVYMIRERRTGAILFIGRMDNPEAM